MNFKLMSGVAAAVLAFAAPGIAAAQDAHQVPILHLASDGLQLKDAESGEVDTVGWGTSQDDAVTFIGTALGDPTSSDLSSDCGAGPLYVVGFQGDLKLYFKAGAFVGWEIGEDSGYSSQNGVRVGMTHKELQAASTETEGEETSIGYEWSADDFHGLLTEGGPNGKVTTIWSGTTCIMR